MKPRTQLAKANTADGGIMALYEQDGSFSINLNGQELMHSKASTSELLLGELGVAQMDRNTTTRMLVGGLGLGFTLKSMLESVGPETTIEVAELIPEVVDWNRTHLEHLNGSLLKDPRVKIRVEDVASLIQEAEPETYDSIVLDVDNGPVAMAIEKNFSLYSNSGINSIRTALKPDGRAVFWSASQDQKFETRLSNAGFNLQAVPAKVHERAKRAAYMLYVAKLG